MANGSILGYAVGGLILSEATGITNITGGGDDSGGGGGPGDISIDIPDNVGNVPEIPQIPNVPEMPQIPTKTNVVTRNIPDLPEIPDNGGGGGGFEIPEIENPIGTPEVKAPETPEITKPEVTGANPILEGFRGAGEAVNSVVNFDATKTPHVKETDSGLPALSAPYEAGKLTGEAIDETDDIAKNLGQDVNNLIPGEPVSSSDNPVKEWENATKDLVPDIELNGGNNNNNNNNDNSGSNLPFDNDPLNLAPNNNNDKKKDKKKDKKSSKTSEFSFLERAG